MEKTGGKYFGLFQLRYGRGVVARVSKGTAETSREERRIEGDTGYEQGHDDAATTASGANDDDTTAATNHDDAKTTADDDATEANDDDDDDAKTTTARSTTRARWFLTI